MQDRLKEIEGTLARTEERKNTILYKLARRRQEEEKLALLGVQRLPTNPHDVNDPKVIEYVLYRLKREIGDKTAHLRDPKVNSIDKDGEAVIRAKNDEVNKLIMRRNQWQVRLAVLNGEEAPQFKKRKMYFGCAKELPEASNEPQRKRPRDTNEAANISGSELASSDDDADENLSVPNDAEETATQDGDYLERVQWLGSNLADSELLREEREAELKAREKLHSSSAKAVPTGLIKSYFENGVSTVPSEEHFKALLLRERKEQLQQRLNAMRKK